MDQRRFFFIPLHVYNKLLGDSLKFKVILMSVHNGAVHQNGDN